MNYDDPTIEAEFALDAISDDLEFEPPAEVSKLIRHVDRQRCQWVQVVQRTNGEFSLVWEERHPEMIPAREYWHDENGWLDSKKQREYQCLEKLLPARAFEVTLTRRQAFALIAACWLPDEFTPEIEALA